MIKSIGQSGKYIQVNNSQASFPYVSPGTHGAGQLRWNINTNNLEVNDGVVWKELPTNYASIGMSPVAEEILDWAYQQMAEAKEMEKLAKDNPAIQAALENLNKAKDQLKATIILSKDYNNEGCDGG